MNTNHLKKFAQQTRTKLIDQISSKLEFVLHTDTAELREKQDQVQKLKEVLTQTPKDQLIEKVAYTWFNRFMALRFMDVNDYQPTGIKTLTPKDNYTLPEILDEAKKGNISDDLNLNRQKVYDLLDGKIPNANAQNEVYKELLIASCNHLNSIFPFLFERINDYTELLLPDDLTSELSIVQDFRDGMSAEDCAEVEIIGWLYQFYISEKKDEVFASKSAVKKEDIPSATQLFTPRWIVEYMVQNTVGKLWLQNKPNSKLRDFMPYFIESPSVESEDFLKLNSVEELTLLDQACGSGHILVYGFELLYKIYEEEGYNATEIPELILTKNLHGFEIDERASQLAGMALMMKARSYHRRFFKKEIKPNILCYQDVSFTVEEMTKVLVLTYLDKSSEFQYDLKILQQATNYGSLIIPKSSEKFLTDGLQRIEEDYKKADMFQAELLERLKIAINQLLPLSKKYHCIVDNPPYMGSGNMNKVLNDFVKTNYPDSKADLMACFMESGLKMLLPKGFLGMINQHSWMFTSSFINLRIKIINNFHIENLLHLGAKTFPEISGEIVQNCAFVLCNDNSNKNSVFFRLLNFKSSKDKEKGFLTREILPIVFNQNKFKKIKSQSISYWASNKVLQIFEKYDILKNNINTKQGLATGKDFKFLYYFYEVNDVEIEYEQNFESDLIKKFYPYNKGETLLKWENPSNIVLKYDLESRTLLLKMGNKCPSRDLYFKTYVTWPKLVSKTFGVRLQKNHIFGSNGLVAFVTDDELNFTLALLCSKVSFFLLSFINPTLAFQKGDVDLMPFKLSKSSFVDEKTKENRKISSTYSGSVETEFYYKQNELIRLKAQDLEEAYNLYQHYWKNKFVQLHKNEEELNRQFIDIYGLQEELTPDVPLEDITILKEETSIQNGQLVFKTEEVFKQLMSYAVGCMFGRYSLDKEGLILANQGETLQDFVEKVGRQKEQLSFVPDADNIIPVLDDEWFEDDIVGRFYAFLKASFGTENFDKNLAFAEECLGKDIRKYFVKDFYADHIKRYKKRPIYWMFSSPKGSFNVLVYLHRYTPDTLNKILTNYLIEYREKLTTRIEHLDHVIVTGSSIEQTKAQKDKDRLKLIIMELVDYERETFRPLLMETKSININLEDGVLVNYNKFGKAIKDVPGLNDAKTKKKVREFDWIDTAQIL